jgi:hypothetical protein
LGGVEFVCGDAGSEFLRVDGLEGWDSPVLSRPIGAAIAAVLTMDASRNVLREWDMRGSPEELVRIENRRRADSDENHRKEESVH